MVKANVVPRGLRNNNPLNIEHSANNKWLGLADPPSDGRFARFKSADYGIRAAALLLMKYQDRDGLRHLSGLIGQWAPAHENNVNSYVTTVGRRAGFPVGETLNLHDRDTMRKLIEAMAYVECGTSVDTIALERGLTMAGFPEPRESVWTTKTVVAASTVAAPVAFASVVAIVDAVTPHTNELGSIAAALGGPQVGVIVTGVLTAITWGVNVWQRMRTREQTGV
jgi:hypothetical protein